MGILGTSMLIHLPWFAQCWLQLADSSASFPPRDLASSGPRSTAPSESWSMRVWGLASMWRLKGTGGFIKGESETTMDENWGVPHDYGDLQIRFRLSVVLDSSSLNGVILRSFSFRRVDLRMANSTWSLRTPLKNMKVNWDDESNPIFLGE